LSTKEPVTDSPDSFAPLAFGHGWEKEYAKIAEVEWWLPVLSKG
jgi:hypothetical protein